MNMEENQAIEQLLDISHVIIATYYQLMSCEIDNNQQEYQKNIEHLNLALDLEDKIYSRFLFNIEDNKRIINKIEYLLQNRSYEEFEKDVIMDRIDDYNFRYPYRNPFLSMEESKEIKKLENDNTILTQYYRDYNILSNYLLMQEIKELSPSEVKEFLIRCKYEKIMSSKLEEKILLKEDLSAYPSPMGKERCLLFNQNSNQIAEKYIAETVKEISNAIYFLITTPSSTQEEQLCIDIVFNINIETLMSLLTREEQEKVILELRQKKILNENNQHLMNRILSIVSKINNTNHSKSKVKKQSLLLNSTTASSIKKPKSF